MLEHELKTVEVDGRIYAKLWNVDGYDMYRTYGPKWKYLYQARLVNTQTNAGGGALAIRFQVASGIEAELVSYYHAGPASNTSNTVIVFDEDAAVTDYLASQAVANATFSLPSVGSASSASGNMMISQCLRMGPGQFVRSFAAAALQNETLTVYVCLLLPITATEADITFDTTGSAGTPSLAASTISTANTLQAVLLP